MVRRPGLRSRKRPVPPTFKRRPVQFKRRRIPRGPRLGQVVGFPKTIKIKHRYTELVPLSDAGVLGGSYLFKCNGMYDPNQSGTGHQPLYFDQMSVLYNHFTVIGSKATFRLIPQGTTVQAPYSVTTYINDDINNTGTVATNLPEQSGAVTRLCTGGVNPSQIIMTRKWSLKKRFMGMVSGSQFSGTPSSDPTETSFYQVFIKSLDGTTGVSSWLHCTIEYIAVWRELKDVASS